MNVILPDCYLFYFHKLRFDIVVVYQWCPNIYVAILNAGMVVVKNKVKHKVVPIA
jgi:hypothetical protein